MKTKKKININYQLHNHLSEKITLKKIFFHPKIWKTKFFGFSISFLLEQMFTSKFFIDFSRRRNFQDFIFCLIFKILEKNLICYFLFFMKNQEESLYTRFVVVVLNRIFEQKLQFLMMINHFRNDIRLSTIYKKFSPGSVKFFDYFLSKVLFLKFFFSIRLNTNKKKKRVFEKRFTS